MRTKLEELKKMFDTIHGAYVKDFVYMDTLMTGLSFKIKKMQEKMDERIKKTEGAKQ